MEKFIDKHTQKITGTIACFDRILFKGYLPISWAENMERFILSQGFLFKDFKTFVTKQSERIKQHAKAMAEKEGRPYIHINGRIRKEEKAREIAGRDGIKDGLICVFSAVEACQSFKLAYGKDRDLALSKPDESACVCIFISLTASLVSCMSVFPHGFPLPFKYT